MCAWATRGCYQVRSNVPNIPSIYTMAVTQQGALEYDKQAAVLHRALYSSMCQVCPAAWQRFGKRGGGACPVILQPGDTTYQCKSSLGDGAALLPEALAVRACCNGVQCGRAGTCRHGGLRQHYPVGPVPGLLCIVGGQMGDTFGLGPQWPTLIACSLQTKLTPSGSTSLQQGELQLPQVLLIRPLDVLSSILDIRLTRLGPGRVPHH